VTISTIDTSAAERRALKIGLRLDAIADNYEAVVPMIREALELGDHETLGYRSPGDYLADRYGKALARLPIAVRRETVAAIDSVQTLSNRSLAPVFDVDQATITRDRRAITAGVAPATPASAPSAESPAEPEVDLSRVDKATGEIHDGPILTDEPDRVTKLTGPNSVSHPGPVGEFVSPYTEIAEAAKKKVTGLDGKEYSRPAPREQKPRRKALTDTARDAGWELRKAVERLQRIAEDDRFSRNKEEVTPLLRGHLINAVEVCQDLLDQIDPEGN